MSSNNPFRNKSSGNIPKDAGNWGESKFKPNVSKSGSRKHLDSNISNPFSRINNDRKSAFHRNKEKLRFNEVAKGAKPEDSTPWNKYKDEIIFKQRDEKQAALQANMESDGAKNILKQREISYRKSLFEQKRKEPTKWEDFAEDCGQTDYLQTQLKAGNNHTQFKTKFKKSKSKPHFTKDIISKDLLENFDSKKLSFEQNDKLRRIITRNTMLASQTSLQDVVNEMKKKKEKKKSVK